MPKISAIEPQKRNGRVNVYIDGIFTVGIDEKLLIDFDIYKGKELDDSEIKLLQEAEKDTKCLNSAFRFLSYRPRSIAEVEKKLSEKFEPKSVKKTIEKLIEYKYLNDHDFAEMWIRNRVTDKGKKALAFELKNKGINKEIIEASLEDITPDLEYENALTLVSNKSKYHNLDRNDAFTKIGGFLARRGYGYEVIKRVINEITK